MHKFVILRIYSIRPHIAVIYRHKNSQPPAGAKVGLCPKIYFHLFLCGKSTAD